MATDPPRSTPKSTYLALLGLLLVPALFAVVVIVLEDDGSQASRSLSERSWPADRAPEPPADTAPARPEPDVAPPQRVEADRATLSAVRPQRQVEPAEAAASSPQDPVQHKIDEAQRLATTDPERSRALLREALELDPNNVTALEALSLKLVSDEKHAEARKLAERCLESDEDNEQCAEVQKFTVERSAEVYKMVEVMRKCVDQEPENVLCLSSMVNYHVFEGRPADAKELADRIAEVAPGTPFADFSEAKIRSATGDYREARILFQKACAQGNDEACFRAETLEDEGW